MPSSGVLGNRDWSGNTPRAPMPKSTSLLQLSSGPNDGCAEPPAGAAARRWATTDSGKVVNKRAPRTAQPSSFRMGASERTVTGAFRSEERRVGKECRAGGVGGGGEIE